MSAKAFVPPKETLLQRTKDHYALIGKVDKNLVELMKRVLPSFERDNKADFPLSQDELRLVKGLVVALNRRIRMSQLDGKIRTALGK